MCLNIIDKLKSLHPGCFYWWRSRWPNVIAVHI